MGITYPTNISKELNTEYERYRDTMSTEIADSLSNLLIIEGYFIRERVPPKIHSMYDELYDAGLELTPDRVISVLSALKNIDWYYHIFNELLNSNFTERSKRGRFTMKPETRGALGSLRAFQTIENFYLTCYLVVHQSFIKSTSYMKIATPRLYGGGHKQSNSVGRTNIPNVSEVVDYSVPYNQSKASNQRTGFPVDNTYKSKTERSKSVDNRKTFKKTAYKVIL